MAKQRSRRRAASGSRRGGRARSSGVKRVPVDHQEIEWQFEARDLGFVESWLGQHSSGAGLAVTSEGTEEIVDTYYDTEDWRFHHAGYVLRIRKGGGSGAEATMKSLAREGGVDGDAWRRHEISEPLSGDGLPALTKASGPVGERLRALLGGQEARPLFEIHTRRQTFELRTEEGAAGESANGHVPDGQAAEGDASGGASGGASGEAQEERGDRDGEKGVRIGVVVLDATEIPLGEGEEPVRLSRVEVEVGEGTAPTPDLWGFVDEMQFALELSVTRISKYEAGLYAAGLSPERTDDLGPTEVDASMSVGEVAFAVLRGQFAQMKAHEPGTRLGEDAEELHDMRVATRRMRAAIKLFQDALPERAKWLREELRQLAGSLGEVRDLDVQIERLEAWKTEADSNESAEFLGKILEITRKRRAEARDRMLGTLNSSRYARFESSFAELLRRGPQAEGEVSSGNGSRGSRSEPITAVAPALLSGRYRKWRKAARNLSETSQPEAYHELRIEGKKLRYALEFLGGVYGAPVGAVVKPLKALQDDLGRHQDAVVAADRLRELGTTSSDGSRISRGTAFTIGVYSERYAREAADLRSALPESRSLRTLLKGGEWKELEKAAANAREKSEKARGKGSKKGKK